MFKRKGSDLGSLIIGSNYFDSFLGGLGDDQIRGNGGNDYLAGGGGSDTIRGGAGDDVIFAINETSVARNNLSGMGDARAQIFGDEGNDVIISGNGIGHGGAGNDIIVGDGYGDEGNDLCINAQGGPGADTMIITKSGYFWGGNNWGADGDRDVYVIDGSFSGNVELSELDSNDVIEFRNVPGVNSLSDVLLRQTNSNGYYNYISIAVDGDTTIYLQGYIRDAKYQFNKTDTDGIINGVNSRIAEVRDTNEKFFGAGNDRFSGTVFKDVIHCGAGNDLAKGGGGNDQLFGQAGADNLSGEGGNDTLSGDAGRDLLTGGVGKDVFDFDRVGDSGTTAATRDVIVDFTHLTDKIDLSTIDANGARHGDAFSFQSAKGAAFTGAAGQLHYKWQGNVTIVEGDTNGDKHADFQIELTGLKVLTVQDFIL